MQLYLKIDLTNNTYGIKGCKINGNVFEGLKSKSSVICHMLSTNVSTEYPKLLRHFL